MISLLTPDSRRALRAIVEAIVALALVALVWYYVQYLHGSTLAGVLYMALSIVAIGTFFYGAENVTRAVKFKAGAGGIEGSVGEDTADAVDAVAGAAVAKAEEIKE